MGRVRANNTEAFDLPEVHGTVRPYVVASTPRSGSTLLCSRLWSTGLAGAPKEYFNPVHRRDFGARWPVEDARGYGRLLRRHRTTANGRFGCKLHLGQLHALEEEAPLDEVLGAAPAFVRIVRADRVAQAISWARVRQTGQWTSEQPARGAPRYDEGAIRECLARIGRLEAGWDAWLAARPGEPRVIVRYEDLVRDPERTVARVLNALGVASDARVASATPLRPQADDVSRAWRRRFERAPGARP